MTIFLPLYPRYSIQYLEISKPLLVCELTVSSGGGVPDGIKCQVCNKVKSKDNYAKRQLQKYNPYNKTCEYFVLYPSNTIQIVYSSISS